MLYALPALEICRIQINVVLSASSSSCHNLQKSQEESRRGKDKHNQ